MKPGRQGQFDKIGYGQRPVMASQSMNMKDGEALSPTWVDA